jgi:oligopeptide/dipeptide ABC transporter ATP-binding protein
MPSRAQLVAGALVAQPELIVADEPVSMLDVSIRAQILETLVQVRQTQKVAFLFITHDLAVAWLLADRIAVMYLGKLVEGGDAQDVTSKPRHPYTIALLDAAPQIHREAAQARRPPLAGETPNATRIPTGCRFHRRCPLAFDRCRVS